MKNTIIRFALTHINRDGMRQLSRANQGRNHFDTVKEGNAYLMNFLNANSEDSLMQIYGKQASNTFTISPVECYQNGDAIGIFVRDKNAPFDIKYKEYLN